MDTNIYRKTPRLDSPEFKSVSYMAKNGCIRLHVPYVVEREFSTFLEQEQRKRIVSATKSIHSAVNFEGKGRKTAALLELLEKLHEDTENIVSERSKSFLDWIESNHSERHLLTIEQAAKALEAYFNGHPPLKEPKVRKDIPDSFIYQSILDLQEEYREHLQVIVEDGALREACVEKDIKSFASLSSFLASDDAQECLKRKLFDDNKPQILEHVYNLAKLETDKITAGVEELLLSDDYRMISGDKVPGENGEIYVSMISTPHSVELGDIEYFGVGLFVVYFSAKAEFDI